MREMVEKHLDEQAEMLSTVRGHIENKVAFSEWAAIEQAAFIAALQPPEEASAFERMKARNLARHLFRQDIEGTFPLVTNFERLDLADRIRADLIGLVRLGAGRYFADDVLGISAKPGTIP